MKKETIYHITYQQPYLTLKCKLVYSNRKSVSIQIACNGDITLRAPFYILPSQLDSIILSKKNWILQKYQETLNNSIKNPPIELTDSQQQQLKFFEKKYRHAAQNYIPQRVAFYQPLTGGNYQNITIRDQKTRWGSCSSRGTLSFNYRLMLAPPGILDYVIVHELCHLTHMDHSRDFWSLVESVLPDYKERRDWLKKHGHELTLESCLYS